MWGCLKGVASNNREPWILLGDFKALSNMDDRIGLVVRYAEIAPILDCLRTCNLMDFKATGKHFTWTNKQDRNQRVFSRIYIVLANSGSLDGLISIVCLRLSSFLKATLTTLPCY